MAPTLMAVHAHPDDESISTGGVLARYAAEGMRVVLVVCTDGGCGDGPGGVKPGEPGHDRDAVVAERSVELARSCAVLGITDVETLGFRDSGMMGWAQNSEPDSFWSTPVAVGADRLGELMLRYRPEVVVTYDANGFYGHPDHIQAHRITTAAAAATGVVRKLYHTAVPRSLMAELGRRLTELGLEPPGGDDEGPREEWGAPDDEVTTWVDVSAWAGAKFESLQAHASQTDNLFFLRMGRELFGEVLGLETFIRVEDTTGAPVPETDLFAGLR